MIGEQIHAYLRAGTGYERDQVGPFLATFTPGTDHPMRNYAIPDDAAVPSPSDVAQLVAVFRERDLRPRLEYAQSAAPDLEAILREAGFVVEARVPLLECGRGGLTALDPPPGVHIADAVTDDEHRAAIAVADQAYGSTGPPPIDQVIAARRAMVEGGGGVVIARSIATGSALGSGLHPIPFAAVKEVAAIATLATARQQGVAASVIHRVAAHAIEAGVLRLWLTAEHNTEVHAAHRAGFTTTGDAMIHISLAATEERADSRSDP